MDIGKPGYTYFATTCGYFAKGAGNAHIMKFDPSGKAVVAWKFDDISAHGPVAITMDGSQYSNITRSR